jgi:hypothetical protein
MDTGTALQGATSQDRQTPRSPTLTDIGFERTRVRSREKVRMPAADPSIGAA